VRSLFASLVLLFLFNLHPLALNAQINDPSDCDTTRSLTDAQSLLERAEICRSGGVWNYEQSIIDTTRAIELEPENVEAYRARAETHFLMWNFTAAIDDLNIAIELTDSRNGRLFVQRAASYIQLNDLQSALDDLRTAIESEPENIDFRFYRADLYMDTGDNLSALADLTVVIQLAPDNAQAYLLLGDIYFEAEDYVAARISYTNYLRYTRDPTPMAGYRLDQIERLLSGD
jgi:tetratricopeptide (TPR) repeat protein